MNEAAIAIINIDIEAADANVDFIGNFDTKYSIPVRTPIAAVIIINEAIEPFADPDIFSIKANIPINILRATVAPANFSGLIIDKATTAAVIIPIATVITIRLPLQSLAPFVALIIMDIIAPNKPTAVIPFIKPGILTKLKATATAAKTPMESDKANNVDAIFGASPPILSTILTSILIIMTKPVSPTNALPISPHSIVFINLATTIKATIAADIPISVPEILGASRSTLLHILINSAMNNDIPVRPINALPISPQVIVLISFPTITNRAIENAIFKSIVPNLSISPLELFVIFDNKPINTTNPVIPTAAFPISFQVISAIILITFDSINKDTDNFRSIFPALFIS